MTTHSPLRRRSPNGLPGPLNDPSDHSWLAEPLWDPVVVIPDPWRRDSTPTADELAACAPRFTWPVHTIADRVVAGLGADAGALAGDVAPQVTLAADLAVRVAAGAPAASGADLYLTEQFTASARALNLPPQPSPLSDSPERQATQPSLPEPPETTGSDIATSSVNFVATVEDITAIADLQSLDTTADAIELASAEIAELKELVTAALSGPADASDAEDFADAAPTDDEISPADDRFIPAMAARVESIEEGSGFDTVRPPLRVATELMDERSVEESSSAMDGEPSSLVEGRLDHSTVPTEVVADQPEEPEIAAVPPSTDDADAVADAVALVADPMVADPAIADAIPEVAAATVDAATSVELPPANESTVPSPAIEEAEPAVAETVTAPAAIVVAKPVKTPASTVLAPAVRDEYNRTGVDFRRPWPRPKVRGRVIDYHCHLLARRHAEDWFEAADHYGMDCFVTMSPLEEAVSLARDWGHRLRFIAVPKWGDDSTSWVDQWLTRIEAFYNLGSRVAKFHAAPGTMVMRGHRLDSPVYKPLFAEVKARGMAIMTHIGDPETWYQNHYTDTAKYGTREEHYAMWESLLEEHRGHPWIGAHLGGNPEDLVRLQRLLDTFPDLMLDCSATRWMVREISARREPAREFFIRNADRILFGSDQVSGDDRQFDFLASRIWCHRKLWETAYIGESPIIDPDVPADQQPTVRGLALPDAVLQKMYHDNTTKLLERLGMSFDHETLQ